jgi:hypothetical protein
VAVLEEWELGKYGSGELEERIIQIVWDGPCTIDEVHKLSGPTDKGLYQVYAYHPLYGDCLVYIGLTDTAFAYRIPAHNHETGSDSDKRRLVYYVGMLVSMQTPDLGRWLEEIQQAEMLLIHSHGPAYNSTNIQALAKPEWVANVRILNWGNCRSLQREVSGRMWSAAQNPGLLPYGSRGAPA